MIASLFKATFLNTQVIERQRRGKVWIVTQHIWFYNELVENLPDCRLNKGKLTGGGYIFNKIEKWGSSKKTARGKYGVWGMSNAHTPVNLCSFQTASEPTMRFITEGEENKNEKDKKGYFN